MPTVRATHVTVQITPQAEGLMEQMVYRWRASDFMDGRRSRRAKE
jgi:hypothetical protein